ncbi:MAG: GDP-mannose 4,6-dehydratase [Halioglobus sp.]|nr:GDP-mannose 4,6-dehydratase [Halioglobus sp.]
MTTLLLTGTDGFTGQHFLKAAQAQNHNVVALESDLTKPDDLAKELCGKHFDYVVHLAAISAVTHSEEMALYQVNLFGTLNLMQALQSLNLKPLKVLVASSANIYGNAAQSPISEQSPTAPMNHYAMSKLAMEHMLSKYGNLFPLVITRPFNYTGPGQDNRFVIPKLVEHFISRKATVELGNIEVEREFNDVRTVCDVYLGLLKRGESGQVYNVCSGNTHSLTQVIELLQDMTGHSIDVLVNPAFVRPDEVHQLCGDPAKLENCLGTIKHYSLRDTLAWMLES